MANSITLTGARVIYRNFSGKPGRYNDAGRRNFSVVIEDGVLADALLNDGWNLKPLRKRDENEPQHWHLPVEVKFDKYPPKVIMIQGKNKVSLNEEAVSILDAAELEGADMIIRPREWEPGKIKAYLRCGYFIVRDNELDRKYADWGMDEEDIPF